MTPNQNNLNQNSGIPSQNQGRIQKPQIQTPPTPPPSPQPQKQEIGSETKCTCNDEYKTDVCPVHFTMPGGKEQPIVVTDQLIKDHRPKTYTGHIFACPDQDCAQAGGEIMSKMNYCPRCGVSIIIQSKIVTEFVNRLMGQ